MKEREIQVFQTLDIAGQTLKCGFFFKETAGYFGTGWLSPGDLGPVVTIGEAEEEYWEKNIGTVDAYAEYSLFSLAASNALMAYDRCVFHAVALRFHDRAWLIAGLPGIGKSTQARTLQELHPNEFSVISGDRPVLVCSDEQKIQVCPSPWNGKEGWKGAEAAPLAGLIVLKRGTENRIYKIKKQDAVLQVYNSIFQYRETEEQIFRTARFAEKILNTTPVWELTSKEVPESTKLLYDSVFSKEARDETV